MAHRDPRGRGSVGAGIVLELGARADASFTPGPRSQVRVESGDPGPWPISLEVASRLAPDRPGTLTVRLSHELPVGQGFGMSAAGALATALAVGSLAGRPRSQSIAVAHLADLFGGGGLGGVAAILGGGLEIRTRPGVPPLGRVMHRPFRPPLLVGVVGAPIPSPSILRDPTALRRIVDASKGWDRLTRSPTLKRFLGVSERFTDRVGLSTPLVERAVSALRDRDAWACQAMFGQSFFARPRSTEAREQCIDWLARHGVRAVEVRAARFGARLQRPSVG